MKKRYIVPRLQTHKVITESLYDVVIVSQGEPTDDFGSKQRRDENTDIEQWDNTGFGNLW